MVTTQTLTLNGQIDTSVSDILRVKYSVKDVAFFSMKVNRIILLQPKALFWEIEDSAGNPYRFLDISDAIGTFSLWFGITEKFTDLPVRLNQFEPFVIDTTDDTLTYIEAGMGITASATVDYPTNDFLKQLQASWGSADPKIPLAVLNVHMILAGELTS